MTDGNTIRSVAKAMELLQLLSDAGEAMTLTAISERAGLPKSTVFGLLTTMRRYDMVTQTPEGRYALGLRLFEYGRQVERSWDISHGLGHREDDIAVYHASALLFPTSIAKA